ncbi:MAG: ParB/RepB/Spo0J family partition protein [Sphingomonadaceae bacterium]|nr:ParB/RepB/Spo0J family partition protein [Sphingomonadaceae bacterium]
MSEDSGPLRRRTGLGRGLSALLGEMGQEQPIAAATARSQGVQMLPVASIAPNPHQPRRHFDPEALEELAASIATRGLIQPIFVRPVGEAYQIVAGERRWRAAQQARLHEVPVIIRALGDEETLEIAIVENVQRADLNAIEEAEAYQRLVREYGHSMEEVGRLVGKSRSHVTNLLRLLDLPDAVRRSVIGGELTMGHARAIANAPDPEALARQVIARGLSVRETEALARNVRAPGRSQPKPKLEYKSADPDILALERQIGDLLGLKVAIAHDGVGGSVTLAYASLDQLDMICQRLSGEAI